MLTREDILQADDLKRIEVKVPEWNGSVYVRQLNGEDGVAMVEAMRDSEGNIVASRMIPVTVAFTACDEEGNLLFAINDVEAIGKKSARALKRIFEVSNALNSISEEDEGN